MRDYTLTGENKRVALAVLKDSGFVQAHVSYSGGNDEGGADSITLYGPEVVGVEGQDRRTLDLLDYIYRGDGGDKDEAAQLNLRGWTLEKFSVEKFIGILTAPVYEKYGSFAGDFSVYGTIVWDVAKGTVTQDGQESSYSGVGDSW